MINPATNITNQTASASDPSTQLTSGAEGDLGRDEFLKLLVAQLQNQDPLKPQDNSQFVAELAQFSNLEQTIGINDRLDALSLQNQGMQNSQIISMVGQTATVRGSMITSDGPGQMTQVSFDLQGDADQLSVTIRDAAGNDIRTLDIGAREAGAITTQWNGFNDQGLAAPAGTYTVQVTAKTEAGGNVATSQETKGVVESVSFEKGYPVLQLSSGVAVPVAELLKIEQ